MEKLLQRLPLTTDVYRWRCLFYCLSCLPATSATLSKYLQNKRVLKDPLRSREVKESMLQVVAKVAVAERVEGSCDGRRSRSSRRRWRSWWRS